MPSRIKVLLCVMQRHVWTSNKSDLKITCQSSQNTIISFLSFFLFLILDVYICSSHWFNTRTGETDWIKGALLILAEEIKCSGDESVVQKQNFSTCPTQASAFQRHWCNSTFPQPDVPKKRKKKQTEIFILPLFKVSFDFSFFSFLIGICEV